ncbi:MAG: OmpA family protein [Alistipes sp.]|nr:OmpA family protein [Alistipes sp.]
MRNICLSCFLLCLFAAQGGTAYASNAEADVAANAKKPHIAGYVSNPFKSNWEIQAGAGVNFNIGTGSGFKNSVLAGAHVGAVKWFHPVFGLRLDVEGGKYMQLSYGLDYKVKWSYLYVHPDVMINLSNWIGGYKDYRVYNAVLYVGAGVGSGGLNSPDARTFEFLGNIGLQNRFYVCKAVSIDLQLQYTLAKATFRPSYAHDSKQFHALSAMIGATYRFNKRTFERTGATEAEVAALNNTLETYRNLAEKAASERDALRKELDDRKREEQKAAEIAAQREAEMQAAAIKEAEKKIKAAHQPKNAKEAVEQGVDAILFYTKGYGVLTDNHKKRLDTLAEEITDSDKKVYTVEGFSDPDTGSEKCNIRLAEKRARLAYEYLLSKGIPAERLQYKNGGVDNLPFGDNASLHNRVVVIY